MAKNKYETHIQPHLEEIKKARGNGATLEQIASSLGVSYSSFNNYIKANEKLRTICDNARDKFVIDLKGSLASIAVKHKLETVKKYIKKEDGKEVSYTEITTKEVDPDVAAINLLLKNLDTNWSNDPQNLALRREELELRKQMAEMQNFDMET